LLSAALGGRFDNFESIYAIRFASDVNRPTLEAAHATLDPVNRVGSCAITQRIKRATLLVAPPA